MWTSAPASWPWRSCATSKAPSAAASCSKPTAARPLAGGLKQNQKSPDGQTAGAFSYPQGKLLLQRNQAQLNPTVGRTARFGIIAGNRLTGAITHGLDPSGNNALGAQIAAHAGGTLLTQTLVQVSATGGIGMAADMNRGILELFQHQGHGVQHIVEIGTDF